MISNLQSISSHYEGLLWPHKTKWIHSDFTQTPRNAITGNNNVRLTKCVYSLLLSLKYSAVCLNLFCSEVKRFCITFIVLWIMLILIKLSVSILLVVCIIILMHDYHTSTYTVIKFVKEECIGVVPLQWMIGVSFRLGRMLVAERISSHVSSIQVSLQ